MESGETGPESAINTGPADEGKRLDRFLADRFPDTPRSHFKTWIEEGRVHVHGASKKPGYRLREGDVIRLTLPPQEEVPIRPEPIPLQVLYEDDALLVVDKPAGLTVHPAPHQPSGTLVNALMARGIPLSDYHGDRFRPGIVHRLDRGTSGVLVVAKNRSTHTALAAQFEQRRVDKEYRAVILGAPDHDEGEIDLPIGRDRRSPVKMAVRQDTGREALTRFRVLERFGRFSHVAAYPASGRTHQIRVHLSAIGHPILSDAAYHGGPPETLPSAITGEPAAEEETPVIARPALHAFRLTFEHPTFGERRTFTAPLPEDLEALLALLRA
ncbi:MAG: RluA family pseudouridine synthase [Planctomycetota bacterium]|jgi:23S rRNA pseudouridine1911/1915/1917 synthase